MRYKKYKIFILKYINIYKNTFLFTAGEQQQNIPDNREGDDANNAAGPEGVRPADAPVKKRRKKKGM